MYKVIRTDTADEMLRKIILHVAENFGKQTALAELDELETSIMALGENPYLGTNPRYMVLRRQGFRVLILKKDLVFYKISEESKTVTIYAIVDQRQDYMDIIRGL